MSSSVLELRNVNKRFSDYFEVKNVGLTLNKGEVHALIGENGSGKSALMKIIMGIDKMDSGEIYIDGKTAKINTPLDAKKAGIYMLHQEPMLFESFSIAENVFSYSMPYSVKSLKIIDRIKINEITQDILDKLNLKLSSETLVKYLGIGQKQFVDIIKAYSSGARIIIMDEPTSALSENEVDMLFNIIEKLKTEGASIVYISHRLNEIKKISDRVSVMRKGEIIGTQRVDLVDTKNVIQMMTGVNLSSRCPKLNIKAGKTALKVVNLSSARLLKSISFSIKRKEILGITGLVGSGGNELVKAIFGLGGAYSGDIIINGKTVKINGPFDAIKNGIGYISEDRSEDDIFRHLKVSENITALSINKFSNKKILIDLKKEKFISKDYIDRLSIKLGDVDDKIDNLSGGNQQKVILAKLLLSDIKIFLLDEPTRGIDVASKLDVYNLMNNVVLNGASIIFVSSDIDELMGMCDRIMVLCDGSVANILSREEFSKETIMYYAAGEK